MKRLAAAAVGLMALVPVTSASASSDALADLRQATFAFHDVHKAEAAGYQRLLDCFDSEVGGMGQHYVDVSRLDATVEAARPEAIVYQVGRDERLHMVAVEYIVPDSLPRPTLYGQLFHHNVALGLWVLHAWIWKSNPAGVFSDYNPNVPDCD